MNKLAYLSFDSVPAPKGAAIHIQAFTKALACEFDQVNLITVSPTTDVIRTELKPASIQHIALPAIGPTFIHRVLDWRSRLRQWLQDQYFQAIHIRSIYEGFPIAQAKQRYCDRLIFEVNGLPSIELKYRYPAVAEDRILLHKLIAQENACLQAADLIITPSSVTQVYLQTRGARADKIRVIPNGVDPSIFTYQPARPIGADSATTPFQLLYFGTLSVWQGVDLAIRALATVQQEFATHLTIVGSASKQQRAAVRSLARKLGVKHCLTLLDPVSQTELVQHLHQSHCVIAPLTLNDRNLLQGCCPLKVLEGMASGTPVITSDLPVVRELGEPGVHFLAVKPNAVQAIVEAILHLRQNPTLAARLSQMARQRIMEHYTWAKAGQQLVQTYKALGISRASTAFRLANSWARE